MMSDDSQLQQDLAALRRIFPAEQSLSEILFRQIPKTGQFDLVTPAVQMFLQSPSLNVTGVRQIDVLAFNFLHPLQPTRPVKSGEMLRLIAQSNLGELLNCYVQSTDLSRTFKVITKRKFGGMLTSGVNLVGYFNSSSGLGEDARLVAQSLAQQGINVSRVALDHVGDRDSVKSSDFWGIEGRLAFSTSIFCISPLEVERLRKSGAPLFDNGRLNIGILPWELPNWPEGDSLDVFSEVWAISDFCYEAFKQAGLRVYNLGTPLDQPRIPASLNNRCDDDFSVLTIFDGASRASRKNPSGAIRAFRQAFPSGQFPNCRLSIKSMNLEVSDRTEMLHAIAGDGRIQLLTANFSSKLMESLFDRADCYLSLARSEGLGRNVAEAILRGLPVVVTDWSGHCDLIPEGYPWAVRYKLIPVEDYPKSEGQLWADADLDDASEKLLAVYEASDNQRSRITADAASKLFDRRNVASIGCHYLKRLRELGVSF
ncbi:glycosyltransferase [uncultured Umboniibacter sp.]|uniref:glycosyltransferase n=1 Tax=uncultured Umboniibacter sp. TaxID=1798917 RepID=UPI00260A5931|nr:glycosyltransferase [uncultured Umboniibacter sp.]